jgi:hypothetical protein
MQDACERVASAHNVGIAAGCSPHNSNTEAQQVHATFTQIAKSPTRPSLCCRRWAERGAVGYEALALDGFMVLGERLRSGEERAVVVEVLQQVLRVTLDLEQVRFCSLWLLL